MVYHRRHVKGFSIQAVNGHYEQNPAKRDETFRLARIEASDWVILRRAERFFRLAVWGS